jgi:P-type Ca2+ transporter type 2C
MQNKQKLNKLYKEHKTSSKGLNESDINHRIEKYGLNKLPEEKLPSIILIYIKQFADPLIYILLLAAIASFAINERVDSYFIFGILIFNAIVGTIQEYSANKSALSLKKMMEAKTFVIRGGYEQEICVENLVPGDIVILKTGNKVPADIILTETDNLQINESMLTGESIAVNKDCNFEPKQDATIQDKKNLIFAGTIVTRGVGKGIVQYTAIKTEMGKIADKITQKSETKSPLLLRMEQFSLNLTIIMTVAIFIIACLAFYRGVPLRQTFLMAIGLALAAIPEGLPVAITVALAIGMNRMAKRNVIVKHLVAVESLGSCTVIASDKTGTLTINELTITEVLLPNNKGMSIVEKVKNYIHISKEKNFNKLSTEKKIAITSVLPNEGAEHDDEFFGDPVDIAFLKLAMYKGYTISEIHKKFSRIKLIPYASENRYSASFNLMDKDTYAFVKGAPETVSSMCRLKPVEIKTIKKQTDRMAQCGLKVLSLACGKVNNTKNQEYSEKHLTNLEFLGLVGMSDPLRPEVKKAIKECQGAGVKVLMITGDNPKTAYTVAKDLKLIKSPEDLVTGYQIKTAKDKSYEELDNITKKSSIYARVEPIQKLDIVKSLTRNGHFVAVTGDGVNDAPALKNASIGVAMGKNGTDIARESANIIITDDNFASIVHGIEEGRVIYSNIRKLIFMLVSTGAAEIGIFIVNMLLGLPLPFFAIQLLWLNVVTEGVQGITLAYEKAEGDEMQKPPRSPMEPIFNKIMIYRIVISALIITIGISGAFYYLLKIGYSEQNTRNIAMMLFVLFENLQVLNSRSEHHSIFQQSFIKNPYLLMGISLATLVHIAATYIPWLNQALNIHALVWMEWKFILPIVLSIIVIMELEKFIRKIIVKNK